MELGWLYLSAKTDLTKIRANKYKSNTSRTLVDYEKSHLVLMASFELYLNIP